MSVIELRAEEPIDPVIDGSRIWLPEVVEHISSFMHKNDIPCSLRLVNKATAAQFRGRPKFTTVRLSQPVPHHAFVRRWGAPGSTRSLTQCQRFELVSLTAASGSIANLEVAVAAAGGPLVVERCALRAAARAGKVDVCDWLLQQGYCVDDVSNAAQAAAEHGQQEAVELLLANGADWDWGLAYAAARGGHPALMDWLLLHRPEGPLGPDDSLRGLPGNNGLMLFVGIARGCSLAALQAVHRRMDISDMSERKHMFAKALEAATISPTADWQAKVEWLEATEPGAREEVPNISFKVASGLEALDRLRWLRQRSYRYSSSIDFAMAAASAGNVAMLEYVLAGFVPQANGDGDDNDMVVVGACAALFGHLEVLKLLDAQGCLDSRTAARVAFHAAGFGQMSLVAWAEKALGLDLPSIPGLMTAASRSGNLELMAWLHERGCGWDENTFKAAAASGCEEAVEWLAERGCPMGEDGEPYTVRLIWEDPLMLRCLQRLGCPWGPVGRVFDICLQADDPRVGEDSTRYLKATWPLRPLRCLVEAGCPVDWEAAVEAEARARNRPEVRSWLLEQMQQ